MKLSSLINKLTEQQESSTNLSTIKSIFDLLSDEERQDLAKFIQSNLDNPSPEQIRKEKQAAATASAQKGMSTATAGSRAFGSMAKQLGNVSSTDTSSEPSAFGSMVSQLTPKTPPPARIKSKKRNL